MHAGHEISGEIYSIGDQVERGNIKNYLHLHSLQNQTILLSGHYIFNYIWLSVCAMFRRIEDEILSNKRAFKNNSI